MTVAQLQAKRDEVLASCDAAAVRFGDRSVQFADARKALALIDEEMARARAVETGTARIRQIRLTSEKGLD